MIATATSADPSILKQVGPVLIGIVATTALGAVAAFVGSLWERTRTKEAWLRERRLDAYSEFIDVCYQVWRHAQLVVSETVDTEQGLVEMEEAVQVVSAVHARLIVVGPSSADDAGEAAAHAARALTRRVHDRVDTGSPEGPLSGSDEAKPFSDALSDFSDVAVSVIQ